MSIPQALTPPIEDLRQFYVGKDISDVPKPAAILDVAIARRHCGSMLDAVRALGVGFRAHVKTHKTTQLARLQAGESPSAPAHFIASTLAEIEHLAPTLSGYIAAGRPTTILYGIPLAPSQAARLAALARQLGRASSVLVIVDHPSQLDALAHFSDIAGFPAGVYLKVDTGYHRAGVPASALNRGGMLERVVELERAGRAELVGLYSHSSLSYADSTAEAAMRSLAAEIEGCLEALKAHESVFAGRGDREITVSVGASPQVASIENFARREGALGTEVLRAALREVSTGLPGGLRTRLELHAGVYSVMDMQQLATNARTGLGGPEEEVALSVVAEVCSVYNGGEREKPEALVAVGTLGLGREPCPSYKGWGVVSRSAYASPAAEEPSRRLIVERISQEHAIVSWEDWAGEGGQESLLPIPLVIGQTVRIFPNHACVTGALYSWYLVVDSDDRLAGTKITDVWVRASGW
ncbi:putative serine dehydratase domain-containing protein [Macrophomina phaseolina]|uniref:Serine dehydratase domain-containing protein n=1 Tax=Macrophomina phaseolina TaxID=35725 RepID=A0ABQ8FZR3_9PEZI|nr:putative serine dehydratase domain-containing protein [Macrophomina phaseolina]